MDKMSKIDMVRASGAYEQILFFALEALRQNDNKPMRWKEVLDVIMVLDLKGFKLDRSICDEAHVRQALFLNGLDVLDGTDEIDVAFWIKDRIYPHICDTSATEDFWSAMTP